MAPHGTTDWSPGTYDRFRGFRLRPARDLLAQVPDLPPGDVVDLGCGSGAAGAALARRFPGRALCGLDASPAMLAAARGEGVYTTLVEADIAAWQPDTPPALIYSNAVLHWLPDHGALMARLARMLAPGGTLAVQMPRQYDAPSHALMRRIAEDLFPDRFDFTRWQAPVASATDYARLCAPLGTVAAWETEYIHRLDPSYDGHPVRRFTESTAMRPFAERLDDDELAAFLAAYEARLADHYPVEEDGSVLFAFRRVFVVVTR